MAHDWLAANPDRLAEFLADVTTRDGEDALAAVKASPTISAMLRGPGLPVPSGRKPSPSSGPLPASGSLSVGRSSPGAALSAASDSGSTASSR